MRTMSDDDLVRRLESLKVERAANVKSVGRYRVRKQHAFANNLADYGEKLDKLIA
jgi:hypothetical protein